MLTFLSSPDFLIFAALGASAAGLVFHARRAVIVARAARKGGAV